MRACVRLVAHLWPLPYTLLGIAIGLILGGRFRIVDGVVEIHGIVVERLLSNLVMPALAITFGHVVLGQTANALEITRAHERVHVRQYERWGLLFIPAYLGASAYLFLRGRDAYRENPFEVEAYAVDQITDSIR